MLTVQPPATRLGVWEHCHGWRDSHSFRTEDCCADDDRGAGGLTMGRLYDAVQAWDARDMSYAVITRTSRAGERLLPLGFERDLARMEDSDEVSSVSIGRLWTMTSWNSRKSWPRSVISCCKRTWSSSAARVLLMMSFTSSAFGGSRRSRAENEPGVSVSEELSNCDISTYFPRRICQCSLGLVLAVWWCFYIPRYPVQVIPTTSF
jgi:hypothetical protein